MGTRRDSITQQHKDAVIAALKKGHQKKEHIQRCTGMSRERIDLTLRCLMAENNFKLRRDLFAKYAPPLPMPTFETTRTTHRRTTATLDFDMSIGQAAWLLLDLFGKEWITLVAEAMQEIDRRQQVDDAFAEAN